MELKFRAWDFEDQYFTHFTFSSIGYDGMITTKYGKWKIQDDDDEVNLFTGLQDDNNIDIYNGDIVECSFDGWIDIFVVRFNILNKDLPNGWYLLNIDNKDIENFTHPKFKQSKKVIGNIYQNPELLK